MLLILNNNVHVQRSHLNYVRFCKDIGYVLGIFSLKFFNLFIIITKMLETGISFLGGRFEKKVCYFLSRSI